MRKVKYKLKLKFKIILIALIVLPFIFTPTTFSKYAETKTKHLTINAVQPTYTVVFHANGGSGSMADQVFTYKTADYLRSNTFTNETLVFDKWTTNSDGTGDEYTDHQRVNNLTKVNHGVIDLYAQWTSNIARIGTTYYTSLADAVAVANNSSTQTTIVLLQNTHEKIQINAGKDVILDLNGKTLSFGSGSGNNPNNWNVIRNYGTLYLKNGKITNQAATNGAVNNYAGGTITIDGVDIRVTSPGNRQAFYNEGGTATLTGGSYFYTESSGNDSRCAVTNKNNGAKMYVIDATIVSKSTCGLNNEQSLYIGNNGDGSVSATTPLIMGATYGLMTTRNFSFYDGIIKGKTAAIDDNSKITNLPTGYSALAGEEVIDGSTYHTRYVGIGETPKSCQIGTTKYETLQGCINAAPNNTHTVIEFLDDISESVTVAANKNIEFDMGTYSLSITNNVPAITNRGTLLITNGSVRNSGTQGAINQESGTFTMTGGEVIATGSKQAVYITGGTANISGTSYLSSKTSGTPQGGTMERATVQVVSGTLNLTGGTIVGVSSHAVSNEGTVNIGTNDGTVDITTPVLQGKVYGIKSTGTFNFYDGIIKGETDAIDGTVSATETGYQVANGTDGVYTTAYLDLINNNNSINPNYSPLSMDPLMDGLMMNDIMSPLVMDENEMEEPKEVEPELTTKEEPTENVSESTSEVETPIEVVEVPSEINEPKVEVETPSEIVEPSVGDAIVPVEVEDSTEEVIPSSEATPIEESKVEEINVEDISSPIELENPDEVQDKEEEVSSPLVGEITEEQTPFKINEEESAALEEKIDEEKVEIEEGKKSVKVETEVDTNNKIEENPPAEELITNEGSTLIDVIENSLIENVNN